MEDNTPYGSSGNTGNTGSGNQPGQPEQNLSSRSNNAGSSISQGDRTFTSTSTRSDEGNENSLGLTRDETLAVVFGLLGGLAMLFGLARCTPIWDQLTQGKIDVAEVAAEVAAPVTSAVETAKSKQTEVVAVEDLSDELEDAETHIEELEAELAGLRGAKPETIVQTQAYDDSALRAALSSAEQDALSKQSLVDEKVAALLFLEDEKARLMKAAADAQDALAAERAEKERLAAELEAHLADHNEAAAAPEPAPAPAAPKQLFAESSEDLAPRAKSLFAGLQGIHTGEVRPADIKDPYLQLAASNKARLVERIPFGTGQSAVGAPAGDKLKALVDKSGDDEFFLVVGYADTTGSADANKELSRERSTSVANVIGSALGSEDNLQAAYVGQTDRFSDSDLSQNRVVEVWAIQP